VNSNIPYLFAYGTLRSEFDTEFARNLKKHATRIGPARVRGLLYDLGEYPALVLTPSSDEWVHGEVFRLEEASRILPELDDYEGCGPNDPQPHLFERAPATVELDSGRSLTSWVYVYGHPIRGERKIPSGDFVRDRDMGLAVAPSDLGSAAGNER
jgi:gamma-glutamylcyclotransferase (GGCT)/AIG2-like uncharacterized protein YtfP